MKYILWISRFNASRYMEELKSGCTISTQSQKR